MADIPILQYKKPNSSQSRLASPRISQSSSPLPPRTSSKSTPTPETTTPPHDKQQHRRVSSRRKALQEFYHIQEQSTSNTNSTTSTEETNTSTTTTPTPTTGSKVDLQDVEQLKQFIQNSKIEDILALRNQMMYKLNSQDSEKKSIIYDNYYELIKLNNTLSDLSKKHPKETGANTGLDALGIYSDESNDDNTGAAAADTKEIFLNNSLIELQEFVNSETKKFTGSFGSVLEALDSEISRSDSVASITTIKEDSMPIPDDIDREKLIEEINGLLAIRTRQETFDEDYKKVVLKNIENVLSKLTICKHELLIIELNELKNYINT
ncbi:uncharacterized protein J8A68_000225 [[Candida] subhashii]|uniref:Vacuolar protein sorting-associated protein 51 homolog n=1 Tax=[Candida] subhashii TaxID=561895 RepID=A0A8J5V2Z7_9ASCO|nr:uncharacterized protein J8A68_000225 [[Candida] subhashii]KAG7666230.1 hypothetical protein J8A68_000225 [[Candida] subhashii]